MVQLPFATTFLISIWLETMVYGFFVCIFCTTLYFNASRRRWHDQNSRVMFISSIAMFILATIHVSINCFRLVEGYIVHIDNSAGWLNNLNQWSHLMKDDIYLSQEILGSAALIYRCWVLYNRRWQVVLLSILLLIGLICCGVFISTTFITVTSTTTVFTSELFHWISAGYALIVIQNALTTSLMVYRIWSTERLVASFRIGRGNLKPIMRIIIETAMLQLLVESLVLILYAIDQNAQFIVLEIITPTVGITFNTISLRLTMRARLRETELTNMTPFSQFRFIPHDAILVDETGESPSQMMGVGSPDTPVALSRTSNETDTHTSLANIEKPPRPLTHPAVISIGPRDLSSLRTPLPLEEV